MQCAPRISIVCPYESIESNPDQLHILREEEYVTVDTLRFKIGLTCNTDVAFDDLGSHNIALHQA